MIAAKIHRLDPYHPVLGFIVPEVAQRLVESAEKHGEAIETVYGLMSRLWARDPNVLLLAALDPDGQVKGHALASIEGGVVYLLQPRIDESTENDVTSDFLALVVKWVKEYNVHNEGIFEPIGRVTLIARRSDPKWAKKYGFTTKHYVMEKEID